MRQRKGEEEREGKRQECLQIVFDCAQTTVEQG